MNKFSNFIQELFMMKTGNDIKVGLTQFKATTTTTQPVEKDVSIRTKDVKLSDLMRRAS